MWKLFLKVVLALLAPVSATAHEGMSPEIFANAIAKRVSTHIYVMHGPRALPNSTNAGFMSNPGFVVTGKGVVVVDPGGSVQVGTQLVKVIRKVTDQPVVAVFNTHIHGDHWLGNDGIRRAFPDAVIYAHRNMVARRETGEGQTWLENFNQVTDGATKGTQVVWPETSVAGGQTLTIGGVQFRIHEFGKAHSDTDIMIEVVNDKAIFLGDIVVHRSWPAVRPQDASLQGYMAAIRHALELPVQVYIPGHGPTGNRNLALEQLQLMEKLYVAVVRHYRQGKSDFEMTQAIAQELDEYRDWRWVEGLGRLVSYVYLEVETGEFQ